MTTVSTAIPSPNQPMVDPATGFITPAWWFLFQRLIARTGGQAGNSFMPISGGTFTGPVVMGAEELSGSDLVFTGGSLDGVTLGHTTPAPGSFTSISASGLVTGAGFVDLVQPYAPLLSPALTGAPTAPTAAPGTNTTQLATTAFVDAAVGATGTVTQVNSGTGITGGPITGVGTLSLSPINSGDLLANTSGVMAAPVDTTLTALIDNALGNTQGDILYRSSGAWTVLAPGTSGQYLTTGGSAANPSWSSVGSFTTLAASGNDALTYNNTSGQTIATATQVTITGWTKIFDRVNANFNASTGIFTAPATGFYRISAGIAISSAGNAVGELVEIRIVANSVVVAIGLTEVQTATTALFGVNASCVVSLTSGQTALVAAFHNMTGSPALSTASGALNFISIDRVP